MLRSWVLFYPNFATLVKLINLIFFIYKMGLMVQCWVFIRIKDNSCRMTIIMSAYTYHSILSLAVAAFYIYYIQITF